MRDDNPESMRSPILERNWAVAACAVIAVASLLLMLAMPTSGLKVALVGTLFVATCLISGVVLYDSAYRTGYEDGRQCPDSRDDRVEGKAADG